MHMKENYMICNCKQVSYYDVENALHQMETFDDVVKKYFPKNNKQNFIRQGRFYIRPR